MSSVMLIPSLLVEYHVLIGMANFCRYLHGNQLTGSIPPELGNMTKLHYLYVLLDATFFGLLRCYNINDLLLELY